MTLLSRRHALAGLAALAFGPAGPALPFRAAFAADAPIKLGPSQPFDFDRVVAQAKALAGHSYQPPVIRHAEILDRIDYDAAQQIRFRADRALWPAGSGAPFPVQLSHPGKFSKAPVRIYQVTGTTAREVLYSPSLFEFGAAEFARKLPDDIGFSGFRLMHPGGRTDFLSFVGASYFRSAGELDQYGLSARGVAVNTASAHEEFPRFTSFWIAEPAAPGGDALIHALLDGPSLSGAFRIAVSSDTRPVLKIESVLFIRKEIQRLGIAPLTSMFWYGKHNRTQGIDWRPEIHDSDGLALATGAGERIWRPLNDPASTRVSAFMDKDPRGFGLLQRERDFQRYQDDAVFYNRRPSVWVEPLAPWGEGAVQLVELPTSDETNDNIVAFWVPKGPIKAGAVLRFAYQQYWLADEPHPPEAGRVIATRVGVGGVPGRPRPPAAKKFVVDFAGPPLEPLTRLDGVEPVVTASRGKIVNPNALPVVGTKTWRLTFDLAVDGGTEPIDLRCYLRHEGTALTETWLYQFLPTG
ncbi:glucan biosynthesis protein D [Aliidongia dinghuensis]|uniref:Glucan biosynthesis protein D n=1 Tax=Aliidongia dinghuensis TaxID=1867774 RepID=A0A8J2YYL8_9PROT|nr:glucan biosynthesis protein D [Aliidongia dinghuensis]GGF33924.1 glucan biosynthesis protein D [Aliidongia dinghuensis]